MITAPAPESDGIILWVGAIPTVFSTLEDAVNAISNSLLMTLDPKVKGEN